MSAARVFLSWASQDSGVAERVHQVLEAAGFEVFFSADYDADDSIAPGEDIEEEVAKRVEDSDAFVALVSNVSLARKWVQKELGFANTWRLNRQLPVFAMRVGDLDLANLPDMFDGKLVAGASQQVQSVDVDLVRGIRKALGLSEPEVVRIALIAMDRGEVADLKTKRPELFDGLNEAVLMANYPLSATADCFFPFRSDAASITGKPLVRLVREAISKVNERRVLSGQSPLVGEFHGRADILALTTEERAIWRESATMVFIDALSMNCDQIRAALLRVPQARRTEQAFVAWLPLPQSIAHVRNSLETTRTSLTDVAPFQDQFHDYVTFVRPSDPLRFEIASEPAAQHSVHAFCESLRAEEQVPQAERRASVRNSNNRRGYRGPGAPGIRG